MSENCATQLQTTRIAIAQIPMHWEVDENVQAMKAALLTAARDRAAVCAFSELALTGFHRRIVEWAKPEIVEPAIAEIQAVAASLGIAVVFGAPSFDADVATDGQCLNSHLFIPAAGELVGVVSKVGLTEPEARFFGRGKSRPTIWLDGLKCSAVICREIADHDEVVSSLKNDSPFVLFWPGLMSPDPDLPAQDPPRHVVQAQALASALGSYVVQTNWPNSLNRPEESHGTGCSACISPTGELLFRLPEQGLGVAVFDLGARSFDWHGLASDGQRFQPV